MTRPSTLIPQFSLDIGITRRDVLCFGIALAVHSLLLLWKGGQILLPHKGPGMDLGDMIVQVGYLSDYPGGGSPGVDPKPGQGGAKGLLARMKSFFHQTEPPATTDQASGGLALGSGVSQIVPAQPSWNKTTQTLSGKEFTNRPTFGGLNSGAAIDLNKGDSVSGVVSVPTSQGNFQTSGPALQEKSFKVGSKETPFQIIKPKSLDELANVNAIAVEVGDKTSGSVHVAGSDSMGPSFKSKELASGGIGSAASFAGAKGTASGNGGSTGSGLGSIAMGGPTNSGINGLGASAGGSGTHGQESFVPSGSGTGEGYGDGQGSGSGGGGGTGGGSYGSGSGSRAWAGGSGFGGVTQMENLPRNRVNIEPEQNQANMNRSGDKDFFITGALAGREIKKKVKPPYENIDGRVALKFSVDWSGFVLDGIVLVLSSGNPSFDQKVMAILKTWVFAPLTEGRTNEIQEGIITFIFKGV